MLRARSLALLSLCLVPGVVAAACGRSGPLDGDVSSSPTPTPTGTDTATPPPTPTPPLFGDGNEGDVIISADEQPTACVALVLATNADVTLADPLTLVAGDRLLVLQVQDEFAVSGDPAPGAGEGGLWEIPVVGAASTGNDVELETPLLRGYHSAEFRRAQACRMPQYRNLTINSTRSFDAAGWDGARGGVVAFFVSETFTMLGSALIDANAAGFRGGNTSGNTDSTGVIAPNPPEGDGAEKGESIEGTSSDNLLFGRFNLANGGGGGNARSAGGGGGGNVGAGGLGGKESETAGGAANTFGLGGSLVPMADPLRLVFGGGGGAGHNGGDSGGNSGRGGDGGGLILIFARTVNAPLGTSFFANGETGADGGTSNTGSGGGGGGGGGTILVVSSNGTSDLTFSALGGQGGDADKTDNRNGPGGGGGGGLVHAANVTGARFVFGGVNGVSQTGNDPYGATQGGLGSIGP